MENRAFTYEEFLKKWKEVLRASNIVSFKALISDLDYMVQTERKNANS